MARVEALPSLRVEVGGCRELGSSKLKKEKKHSFDVSSQWLRPLYIQTDRQLCDS